MDYIDFRNYFRSPLLAWKSKLLTAEFIVILTTNRVTVFDEAVQSRIHLGIKYDQLSKKAKAEIWTAFIQQANKVSTTGEGGKVSPKQLDDHSRRDFNGRQVRTATHKPTKRQALC